MKNAPELAVTEQKVRILSVPTDSFKTVALSLNILIPIVRNTAENIVLASYLSHSSKRYGTLAALSARLEELYGADLSGNAAKLGDAYRVRLSLTCIDDRFSLGGESVVEPSLKLLLQALLEPLADENGFCARQLETELRLKAEEIESELNDKRAYALTRMLETMCAGEPFGLTRTAILKSIGEVTPESMLRAWRELLRDATVQLNVIGNVDAKVCRERVEKAFAVLPQRCPVPMETVFVRRARGVTEKTEEMNANQSRLVLGLRTGMRNGADDFHAVRLMTDLFGGGPYSRLFRNVREKLSLCYYCEASLLRQKGILVVQSGIERKNRQRALDEIYRQLEIMRGGGFEDGELEASGKALCDLYRGVGDSPETLDAYYASRLTGEPETPEETAEGLKRVTREQVVRAAERLSLDTVYTLAGNGGLQDV